MKLIVLRVLALVHVRCLSLSDLPRAYDGEVDDEAGGRQLHLALGRADGGHKGAAQRDCQKQGGEGVWATEMRPRGWSANLKRDAGICVAARTRRSSETPIATRPVSPPLGY